ncbi:MAG: hypothetical protein AB7J63_18155, partial [Vicinamibacterales bacterium]
MKKTSPALLGVTRTVARTAIPILAALALAAPAAHAAQPPAQGAALTAPAPDGQAGAVDDDAAIRTFLQRVERLVLEADVEGFAGLVHPLGNSADALAFARAEIRPGATRVVVLERERQDVTLSSVPGGALGLTVDVFI